MRVVVTGGAGFIGSHVAKALRSVSIDPVVVDNLSTGHEAAVRWGSLHRIDIRDTARLLQVLREVRPDAVIHLAASAYVGESVEKPLDYYDNNVVGTLSLLEAMRQADVGHLVFSSSCATYGIPDRLPITEASPQLPINPYGETKLAGERAIGWAAGAQNLRWMALRYFNAAGADPEGEIGELHTPETHLIPLAIQAALGMGKPLTVFGTDYPTPDGTALRDYVHVSDLASAHVAALRYLVAGGQSRAVNLGTGRAQSVLEIIEAVKASGAGEVPVRFAARRAGDPPCLYADASLAGSLLGWRPQHSGLDEVVATAARFQRGRLGAAGPLPGRLRLPAVQASET